MKALIALFAASLVTTAIADDHPKEDRAMRTTDAKFEKLDRDNDERLSKSEARKQGGYLGRTVCVCRSGLGRIHQQVRVHGATRYQY